MTAIVVAVGSRGWGFARNLWATMSAVLTRELRWRMRGRRAFVLLTLYAVLLALLAFGIYTVLSERALSDTRWLQRFRVAGASVPSGLITSAASARIGGALYGGFLGVLTMLTLLLAPALASGAVSTEREKQTLPLLVTSPISTLGMLVAKLIASLAYVFLLMLVSIPLMGVVFAFGGVAPEDVLRAYLFLPAMAIGLGGVGMFFSALVGRTQVATVLSYVAVLVLTFGTLAVHTFLLATSGPDLFQQQNFGSGGDASVHAQKPPRVPRHAPEPLLWLNPIAADIDLACTAVPEVLDVLAGRVARGRRGCEYVAVVVGRPKADALGLRDALWPRSAVAFLALGLALTVASTQLVTPTRRLRLRRPARAPTTPDQPDAVVVRCGP